MADQECALAEKKKKKSKKNRKEQEVCGHDDSSPSSHMDVNRLKEKLKKTSGSTNSDENQDTVDVQTPMMETKKKKKKKKEKRKDSASLCGREAVVQEVPETKEAPSEAESVRKKKKKKHKRCDDELLSGETTGVETGTAVAFPTPSKPERDAHAGCDTPSLSGNTDDVNGLKKKKKKKKDTNAVCDTDTPLVLVDIDDGIKKKKKKKKKDTNGSCDTPSALVDADDVNGMKKEKKKKKKDINTPSMLVGVDDVNGVEKEMKMDKNALCDMPTVIGNTVDEHEMKKKRKKRKHKEEADEVLELTDNQSSVRDSSKGGSHDVSNGADEIVEDRIRSKKRKKTEEDSYPLENSASQVNGSDSCELNETKTKKKKKKKDKHSTLNEFTENSSKEVSSVQSVLEHEFTEDTHERKKKKKSKKRKAEIDSDAPVSSKESVHDDTSSGKKSKKKRKSDAEDCVNVSNETGSLQNNSPNSGEPRDDALSVSKAKAVGQWDGNLFDNQERQNKFLRLMGGFRKASDSTNSVEKKRLFPSSGGAKKGLFGSLGAEKKGLYGSLSAGGNLALSTSQSMKLTQSLEEQFERAREFSFSKTRGIGLGFEAPPGEGKKFHIDKNKVNSIKFDDDD